jgi:molybdopterin-containing oxidoreductase family iron-sulfur binding subunit
MLLANEATYGKRPIPSYKFDNAKVIVSLGADFLGTWLSPIEFAKQYAKNRKINEKAPTLSKHYQFESIASLTGSKADERYLHRPSETGAVAVALLNAINGQAINLSDAALKEGVKKAAVDLVANKDNALVVSGSNDVNVQIIVNAINEALQSGGKTIDWTSTYNTYQGIYTDFARLVEDMNAGNVGALLIVGANPAYTWFDSARFFAGMKKLKFAVSFNPKNDETTQLCKYVSPNHHFLESWGDAEPKTGYYSLMQPRIYPLFKTRQWQDSLLKLSGASTDYLSYLKTFWAAKAGGETGWDKAMQYGVLNPATVPTPIGVAFNSGAVNGSLAAIAAYKIGGKVEVVLYQKVSMDAGQTASHPWLQEMPDPVTRATWDNYIMISPAMAKTLLGIDLNIAREAVNYEVTPAKPVVKVTSNGKSYSLPVLIIPGVHPDTVGIAFGYGRTKEIGKAADGVGQNVFPLASMSGATLSFVATDATVEKTGATYPVALMQTHNVYTTPQGTRTEVMMELTLKEFKKDPEEIRNDRQKVLAPFGGLNNFEKEGTIYPYYDKPGIHWGMNIDLNACTGCGACVIACHAENNVPVVGKPEVLRFHDTHWLRIGRYYSGNPDNPKVVFKPMMCQQCDNAPCENVCPVGATNHSSEGLNQMAYNRCIGTRYCANNCPYKVRRFNWADYTGVDSFPDNQRGIVNDVVLMMNDGLTRMVLTPDVTVRSRGVMEKCSFCVQRLQEGKLKAKKENRPLISGEDNKWDVKTACQEACLTDAIVFGNVNDSHSAITITRKEN